MFLKIPESAQVPTHHRLEWTLVALISIVGGVLRLWALGKQSLWIDEAFSVWVAQHSIGSLVQFVSSVDQHPPLYYLLLHGWMALFGDSERSVRSLSALLSIATIPLFYIAGKKLVGRTAAMVAVFLLALSPFHIRYAQEARMYALAAFLAAGLLYARAVWFSDSMPRTRRRYAAIAALVFFETTMMYTHNNIAVTLPVALNAAVFLAWGIQRRRGACGLQAMCEPGFLLNWVITQVIVFVLWLPWLPAFVHQSIGVYHNFWIQSMTAYSIWSVFHNFNLAFPEGWYPVALLWDIIYWSMAALGLYALRKKAAVAIMLGSLFLIPASIVIVISLQRPILSDRALIWTTLSYFLLIGCGIGWLLDGLVTRNENTQIRTRLKRLRPALGVSFLLLVFGLTLFSINAYFHQFHKEDWRSLTAYIVQNVSSEDIVLINASWSQIPLDYYALRSAAGQAADPVQGELAGMPVTLFGSGELEPRMQIDDIAHLRETIAPYSSVWLLYAHEWYTDPNNLIIKELANNYTQVDEQHFQGPRVLHFQRDEAAQ